ncbi:hypothetical protein D187_005237 [Cystobacter fuscus DSM 2262]|uniref:Uncharacterized protein n=1 Tax=Cystobacter fuscus (strain ATCC 25194 / DSM 2262 / NBRC 100088 / M29) TaxID=1242864 RepID=S9QS87_CYSF2|nr:hypothetical protein [Cystobacter fuscus]EPX64104.1 hypothetical protein D187_005237 [Cystobacter fuscus DSM 2262]
MISLANVLGAILKDFSQARMNSDAYSRDISRYYEKDPLLRGFPVPRADIESVELELKFAFKSAMLTEARDMDSADRLHSLIDEYKLRTARRAVDLAAAEIHGLREQVRTGETTAPGGKSQQSIETLLYELEQRKGEKDGAGTDARAEPMLERLWQDVEELLEGDGLKQATEVVKKLLEPLSRNLESNLKQQLNLEQLAATLFRLLEDKLLNNAQVDAFLGKLGVERKQLRDEYQALLKPELTAMLRRFIEALKLLLEEDDDCELEVLFTAEQLASVPESAISSLKLRTNMRNYKWNEEEDEDTQQVVRQLLPE